LIETSVEFLFSSRVQPDLVGGPFVSVRRRTVNGPGGETSLRMVVMVPVTDLESHAALDTSREGKLAERAINEIILLNVIVMCLLSMWLRVCDLGNLPGVNGDEAWYGV